jgi:glycosyltransferase involved in cell wall biosynthesis
LRDWLPEHVNRHIERELRRRWHPKVDSNRVTSISRYHLPATAFRRMVACVPPLRNLELNTWADVRFDRAVARRLTSRTNVRIVHAFEGGSLATLQRAKQMGLATILDVPSAHEYFRKVEIEEGGRPRRLPHLDITAERDTADFLFAPSDYVSECLANVGVRHDRIIKIPYAADPLTFRPKEGSRHTRPFRALFVGQIGYRKGLRYLLEAWHRLGLHDAELVLVGRPDKAGSRILKQYSGCFRWIGTLPRHEIHRWFQESDVFVFPTLAEGSAYVTYEAMASGLPLITTKNSGSVMRDRVEGFVVPVRDVDAICDRIRALYDNPDLRVQMGAMARRLIEENFSWQHYHRRVVAAYQAILRGDAPQGASA